jgi:DNA-binding transcriptional ArsR family regulator
MKKSIIPYYFNKTTVFLPKRVYHVFENEGKLDSLALYIQLKKKYQNSKIFNYSLNKLNLITGLSIGTLSKHISVLKRLGLIEIDNKVLTFRNPKKLVQYANKNGKIKMSFYKVMDSYRSQKIFLKNFKVLCNIKKQLRVINTTTNKLKSQKTKTQSAIAKRKRKGIKYATLSNFTYATKINKSKATVLRYKKVLSDQNVIKQEFKFKSTKFKPNDLKHLKSIHFFNEDFRKLRLVNGKVMEQLSNKFEVPYY